MAIIPRKQSQARPTTEAPTVRRDVAQEGQTGRNMQAIGQQISDVADQFRKLHASRKIAEATNQASREFATLKTEAANDPDLFSNKDKYIQRAQQIRSSLNTQVPDAQGQINLNAQLDNELFSTVNDIESGARKKEIDRFSSEVNLRLEDLKRDYFTANEKRQGVIRAEMGQLFDAAVERGAMTRKSATEEQIRLEKELRTGQVIADAEIGPDAAASVIDELNKGKRGAYPDLTPEERNSLNSKITTLRKRQLEIKKLENSREYFSNDQNLSQAVIAQVQGEVPAGTPRITEEDIRAQIAAGEAGLPGGINKSVGNALIKLLDSANPVDPKITPRDKAEMFATVQNAVAPLVEDKSDGEIKTLKGDIEKLSEFRALVIKNRAGLDQSTFKAYMNLIQPKLNESVEQVIKRMNTIQKSGWFNTNIFAEQFVEGEENQAILKARLGEELLEAALNETNLNEEAVNEMARKVIQNFVRESGTDRARFEVGDVIPTINGPVKIDGFTQDGRATVVAVR